MASWALPGRTPASVGRRQLPKNPTGVKTLTTANNVTIRYKEPGKEGVCETTPGVKSYSGYVDTSPESHTFFWFFEARHNPETAPITLWLNGGPGSDSLIGLFEGLQSMDGELRRFFNHFYEQNERIANGTIDGVQLNFNSLGIINGIIDEAIQAPYYPEFAVNNTYGIKAVNETVYNYMKFANQMPNGCQDMISACKQTNRTALADYALCAEATNMCRDNDPTPPSYYNDFLAKDSVMDAIGVNINYTQSNNDVYYAFQQKGDFVWPNFIEDLEEILALPVRVSLIYGDADYICNWFGGEAVSLAANYSHAAQFRSAGYTPLKVNGVEYGETREYGNFSFTRVYEAGHEVPYYQPIASLQLFNRTLFGWDIAEGQKKIWPSYKTNGTATATHTQSSVSLPTATGMSSAGVIGIH
ncbi:hypothetical protein APSETT445_006491 [Aspergillus pseudonomiae]